MFGVSDQTLNMEKRIRNLEKTLNGNGDVGLCEEVRDLKSWTAEHAKIHNRRNDRLNDVITYVFRGVILALLIAIVKKTFGF